MRFVGCLLVTSGVWMTACGVGPSRIEGADPGAGGAESGPGDASSTPGPGTAGDPVGGGGFCAGTGPVVEVKSASGTETFETCTGRIAEARFQNALCTCENATLAGYLRVRGFDSRNGPFVEGEDDGGAAVGVNGTYAITTGYTDIGGPMAIAGDQSVSFAGYLKTLGDFRAQGAVTVAGYTRVERDAWLGAGLLDLGPVTVGRDLVHEGAVTAIPLSVGGENRQEDVTVAPPCPCGEDDLLDVGALVDASRTDNDNAAAGIDPAMFNLVVGLVEATLPCGRFFIERMAGIGDIRVNVKGRVALFVDDSITATGNLEFVLDPGAEIDLFVRNDLVLTGRAVFGDAAHPAATRIYVGGDGDVLLTGAGAFVGNVYAPRSLVTAIGFADVYGSVFAKDFVSPGYARFAYDRAIQDAGDSCDVPTPPPGSCDLCGTCTGGTACVDGSCGACRTDADCCGQLVCTGGTCEAFVLY